MDFLIQPVNGECCIDPCSRKNPCDPCESTTTFQQGFIAYWMNPDQTLVISYFLPNFIPVFVSEYEADLFSYYRSSTSVLVDGQEWFIPS